MVKALWSSIPSNESDQGLFGQKTRSEKSFFSFRKPIYINPDTPCLLTKVIKHFQCRLHMYNMHRRHFFLLCKEHRLFLMLVGCIQIDSELIKKEKEKDQDPSRINRMCRLIPTNQNRRQLNP